MNKISINQSIQKNYQLIDEKKFGLAEQNAHDLLKQDPNNSEIFNLIGDIHYKQNNFDKSVWYYFSSIDRNFDIETLNRLSVNISLLNNNHAAKNILTEHEKKISNSKAEVKQMISKASEEAEKNVIKTNQDFHNLMDSRKKNAEERIKQLKNQALKDIKNASVKIAIESVEKLIKNSLDKSKLDKIYTSSLEETKLALKKKSS